jgi:predicted MPP superfamily phosphohydrolase
MELFIFLIVTEALTWLALYQHFYKKSPNAFYIAATINLALSIWLWIGYVAVFNNMDRFATYRHTWLLMNLIGLLSGVALPRIIFFTFHFTGRFIKSKKSRSITYTGMVLSLLMSVVIALGVFHGRFNIKTENINIDIYRLPPGMEGFRIVLMSDLHLPAFYEHEKILQKVISDAQTFNPDLIINTGDFVDIASGEYGGNDTILRKVKGKYGNFAVLGNHDIGTYHPQFTAADIENNISKMNMLLQSSGFRVLTDENVILDINGTRLAIIGVITRGRHPRMIHGDLRKAMAGTDSADFRILLAHDPNQWQEDVAGKTGIELTLSGHTHGMQMGIVTKKFMWSPAKYFYPHWGGLFSGGNQFHYVNRGLGVLAMPFRIWMPPELTVITLHQAQK